MKKRILVGMCIVLCSVLLAEEALWVTTGEISAWREDIGRKTFPKDTKVILDNYIYKDTSTDRDGCIEYVRDVYRTGLTIDGEGYYVDAKNIIPIDTPDLFDAGFLSVAHYPHRYLIPSYFADVLKSGTRSTMIKYEKHFVETGDGNEYDPPWWKSSFMLGESIITQSFLHIKLRVSFFVKRIEKIPNGYKVEVKRSKGAFGDSFFPSDRFEYPLFFQFDGDYVDIYVDDLSNKVLSLTYVSPEFYEGVKTVISDDVAVDLSNLIWPRRLDGNSDYDDKIIPRQELPQIYRDPLQDTLIIVDETTTLEELKEALETTSMSLLDNASVLRTAISNNANLELIKSLIEIGANVNATTSQGWTALMSATDNLEITKLLIDAGADESINQKNDNGNTALLDAVLYTQNIDVIKFLIVSGAKVNGQTLIYAVEHSDNIELYKLLIEAGADAYINEKDIKEQTAIARGFALNKSPEIISILLNAGASLEIVDNRLMSETEGMSIFEISQEYEQSSFELLSKLIEMGWEENSDDKIIWQERGKTYLTTDNLRLRATEGVSGNPLFTLPKDTPVKILSIGNIEKIDDIIAYWVEVEVAENTIDTQGIEVQKGAVGWCFGGYLTNENIAK